MYELPMMIIFLQSMMIGVNDVVDNGDDDNGIVDIEGGGLNSCMVCMFFPVPGALNCLNHPNTLNLNLPLSFLLFNWTGAR